MKLKTTIITILATAAAGFFTACSDWTEQDPIEVKTESPIDSGDSPLYQRYLELVRNYKQTEHQILIGWFDNSVKQFGGRGAMISAVPEKVDIISLLYADNLTNDELAQINAVRKDKATKIIYTIDYESFREDIDLQNEMIAAKNEKGQDAADEAGTIFIPEPLIDVVAALNNFMDAQLTLLNKYQYDGVSIYFNGIDIVPTTPPATVYMEENVQNVIFGKFAEVINLQPSKIFILEGKPQNVLEKDILHALDYIVLHTEYLKKVDDLNFAVKQALVDKVPTNNIVVCAALYPLSSDNPLSGEILDINGKTQPAVEELAYWVTETVTPYKKSGLGIPRLKDDYYNSKANYKQTKEAIEIMNASPKK